MYNKKPNSQVPTFSHFSRAGYAIFASLHRQVRIGVLSVATLGCVCIEKVEAKQCNTSCDSIATSPSNAEEDEPGKALQEVTVAGTLAPLTQLQAARIVSVITRSDIEQAAAQTVNDVLKLASGVDVRQRGAFGIQTDISINGATFDQITILLNGVNISNPHTGHLAADFPVSPADIERIEVLEGAASRVYGASAFGGAINIVTKDAPTPSPSQRPTPQTTKRPTPQTTTPPAFAFEAGAQGGTHLTAGADFRTSLATHASPGNAPSPAHTFSTALSALWQRSDGATTNSDFQRGNLFWQGHWDNRILSLRAQAGWSHKRYGANTFYSAAYPNQWEGADRIIASVGASTKGRVKLSPQLYWQRSFDHFQLIRNTHTGENFHRTDVLGARVGLDFRWVAGHTAVAAQLHHEAIYSTNLGRPLDSLAHQPRIPHQDGRTYPRHDSRTNLSLSAEHNVLLGRFTASIGILAFTTTHPPQPSTPPLNSKLSTLNSQPSTPPLNSKLSTLNFYPGIDLAYRINSHCKTFLSYNHGFRLPTFTDLYYKSPTIQGNTSLKAEQSHSLQAAFRFHNAWAHAAVRAFYNRGRRMIDWVMYHEADVFHSANFNLDNIGFSADARIDFTRLSSTLSSKHQTSDIRHQTSPSSKLSTLNFIRTLSVGYTYIHQHRRDHEPIYKSNYAMEYLRHKFTAQLQHDIWSRLTAGWQLRVQDREGSYIRYADGTSTGQLASYRPYALLDLKLQWTAPRYLIWAEVTNLTNHRYYDLGNIPQPGIIVLAGARVRL